MQTANIIVDVAKQLHADHIRACETDAFIFNEEFRKICENNGCGQYGSCYTCPPACGTLDELQRSIRRYSKAVVISNISLLEDSFDFEGMIQAGKQHDLFNAKLRKLLAEQGIDFLMLGSGGCKLCETCGMKTGEPCRHPDETAIPLEACGINVSELAKSTGLNYINGENTVTFFSAVLFN